MRIIFIQHVVVPITEGFMTNGAFVHTYARLSFTAIQKSLESPESQSQVITGSHMCLAE